MSTTSHIQNNPCPHTMHLQAHVHLSFSKYLFFYFLFTLICAHHLCSYHHPRPHTMHPHARPSACKTIHTQHIRVCMLPFQVSFFFFLLFLFALIGIHMQCHLHTMHSCLHAPILSKFFFSSLFFALIGIRTSTRNTSACSKFIFSFFFLYTHPHLHANTSAGIASTHSCPPSNLCAGIYLVSFLFSSLFPAPFFLYSHLFFTSHLPPHTPASAGQHVRTCPSAHLHSPPVG